MELNSRLEKYIKEFDDDVQLTISNIKEKSLMVSSYQSKWIRYYFQEKNLCQKLKDAKLEYTKQHAGKLSFKPTQTTMPQIQVTAITMNPIPAPFTADFTHGQLPCSLIPSITDKMPLIAKKLRRNTRGYAPKAGTFPVKKNGTR